jgi:outer membrane protein OmpA-like peptidoglycan-associated protein
VRNKFGLVILGMAFASVAGCSYVPDAVNPIEWYRDATGLSKNDNLGKGENEQNLQEGSNEPFPNLASVPAAPDTQLSGVDREKLVKSLVADRNNAQYSADNLRAGDVANTVPPPAPARSAPSGTGTISPAPASPPPAASSSASPPASSSGNAGNSSNNIANDASRSVPPRGSEAPPAESSLQSPTIGNLPEPERATPAPPRPPGVPPNGNRVATASPPKAPARAPSQRAPNQQATAPATAPTTSAPTRHSAISYRVADISFAPGSAYLTGAPRGTIAEIVKLHNEEGGTIRIIGFGEASGKDAAMAGLTLALDRAQAVAVALTDAGISAKDIAVDAAPVTARGGGDAPHAEVYLEH